MKRNESEITGILHKKRSEPHYNLRRYFPSEGLSLLVEQYWLVNWEMPEGAHHLQQNLPDPNCHLTYDKGKLTLLGPVSKAYSYRMEDNGGIVGVKFLPGVLPTILGKSALDLVDRTFILGDVLDIDQTGLINALGECNDDERTVGCLEASLLPFSTSVNLELASLQSMVALIKSNPDINRVEQLATETGLSVRAIQRRFQQFLGLQPKWLIRKYRMHQALAMLEREQIDIADIVVMLDYSDQSHLIRDFKDMLGVTPRQYILT